MKRSLTLMFCLSLMAFVSAQKANLKNFYTWYPQTAYEKLDPEPKTYKVVYHSPIPSKDLEKLFVSGIAGLSAMEEGEADLVIHLVVPRPVVKGKSASPAGNENLIKFSMPISMYVRTNSGAPIFYRSIGFTENFEATTPLAADKLPNTMPLKKAQSTQLELTARNWFISQLSTPLNELVSYFEKMYMSVPKVNRLTWVSGKGKHDYSALDNAIEAVREASDLIKEAEYQKAYSLIEAQIPVWEQTINELNVNDKKAKVTQEIADGMHLNLANAYFLLQDLEKVRKHFAIAVSSESKKISNSRFALEDLLEEATGPGELAQNEYLFLKEAKAETAPGTINLGGGFGKAVSKTSAVLSSLDSYYDNTPGEWVEKGQSEAPSKVYVFQNDFSLLEINFDAQGMLKSIDHRNWDYAFTGEDQPNYLLVKNSGKVTSPDQADVQREVLKLNAEEMVIQDQEGGKLVLVPFYYK